MYIHQYECIWDETFITQLYFKYTDFTKFNTFNIKSILKILTKYATNSKLYINIICKIKYHVSKFQYKGFCFHSWGYI